MKSPTNNLVDPPRLHTQPLLTAALKRECADFVVHELLETEFAGTGEHLYLQIEKSGMNTHEVVELLQTSYRVTSVDIGYSGLKDRNAVTRQWFSIRTSGESVVAAAAFDAFSCANPSKFINLIDSVRHQRKLKRGTHRANFFSISLRDVHRCQTDSPFDDVLQERIRSLSLSGFPNYIGPQRFGHRQQNLERARNWFDRRGKRASKLQRSLWLSSARSAIFNDIVARRVTEGSWDHLLEGEPVVLDGSRSFFLPLPEELASDTLRERLQGLDVHPSAPWWGRGNPLASGHCAQLEATVLTAHTDLCKGLEMAGMVQERRALRAVVREFHCQWINELTLNLRFSLAPGVYATTLLREIGDCREGQHHSPSISVSTTHELDSEEQ